jgi:peptide chain release factor|nr:peptide chain release factor H [Neorhizobium tomejilense]
MAGVDLLVTTGGGPAECRIALARCIEIVSERAAADGCDCEVLTIFEGDKHGPKSVILRITGSTQEQFASRFTGSIKFRFNSPVRPNHGRKNWFLAGTRINIPEARDVAPKDEELAFETFRAGGPGGQHQNKTDSAVRVRHLPTGIAVVSRNERSQHQNKKEAVQMLARILKMADNERRGAGRKSIFLLNKDIERGNAVQTFSL